MQKRLVEKPAKPVTTPPTKLRTHKNKHTFFFWKTLSRTRANYFWILWKLLIFVSKTFSQPTF